MAEEGWEPLDDEPRRSREELVREITEISPFQRLSRAHAVLAAADASVAIALAGSLFFDISPQAARWRVAAYLAFSLAPFVVIAPLIGPAIDRLPGGRRLAVVIGALLRAVIAVLMALAVNSLLLFPLAFSLLVLQKAHAISKAALVPTVVRTEDELVEANAKLGLVAGLTGFVVAVPAVLLQLAGPQYTLGLAAVLFLVGAGLGLRLTRDVIAAAPADAQERAELHAPGIVVAGTAMGLLRGAVGFLTFQVAFMFRREGTATAWFGVVLAASALATMAGNTVAGRLRRALPEERMLVGAMFLIAVAGFAGSWWADTGAAVMVAMAVGFSAAIGRLAFDAIVQRDAPDANRGRAFARFETRFQLAWVLGAAVPVVVALPPAVGFFIVAAIGAFSGVSYLVWSKRVEAGAAPPVPVTDRMLRWSAARFRRKEGVPAPGSPLPPPASSAEGDRSLPPPMPPP